MKDEEKQAYKELAEGLSKDRGIVLRRPIPEEEQKRRDELTKMAEEIEKSRCRPIYLDNFELPTGR